MFQTSLRIKGEFSQNKIRRFGCTSVQVAQVLCDFKLSYHGPPFKYLGILVGGNHRRKSFWQDLMAKIKKRLVNGNENIYPLHIE